jgi:hypothetical protein
MHRTALAITVVALMGCGGGAKYHVNDDSLATASTQEKQGIFVAQSERDVAKSEQQKAEADLRNADNEVGIAENDYKAAKLQLETAKLTQKSAEQASDVNRKNAANRDMRVAELGVKAADARVDWLNKKRKWIKAQREAAEEHYAAAEARVELEKAKLAATKGIKPSEDFNPSNFEAENLKKQQKYSEARMDADKMQADVDNLERQYKNDVAAFEQAKAAAR